MALVIILQLPEYSDPGITLECREKANHFLLEIRTNQLQSLLCPILLRHIVLNE